MEFHLRLGGLRRHLGGLFNPPPSPSLVRSLISTEHKETVVWPQLTKQPRALQRARKYKNSMTFLDRVSQ